jgi:hypothetical protein
MSISYETISFKMMTECGHKNPEMMNLFGRGIFILTQKCAYPFSDMKRACMYLGWTKNEPAMADRLLDVAGYTDPTLFMKVDGKDVLCVALMDLRRIDRLATKAGEERKGHAKDLLMALTEMSQHLCKGYSNVSASVSRSVIPVFKSAGWIVMCEDEHLKKYTYQKGGKPTSDVAMIPEKERSMYSGNPKSTVGKKETVRINLGWGEMVVATICKYHPDVDVAMVFN